MFEIRSHLKFGNQFLPVNECNCSPEDLDYVEGAITMTAFRKPLLTLEEWDYVDQLWAYFVNGLSYVLQGENFETYFPDQPLRIAFKTNLEAHHVLIEVGDNRSAQVDLPIFMRTMIREARTFFQKLEEITNSPDRYSQELADLDLVAQRFAETWK